MPSWDRFVCVDWAEDPGRRRAWVAEVGMRRVAPAEGVETDVASLVGFGRALPGRTVIAIDAALGVPRHYLEAARRAVPAWSGADDFPTWLALASARPEWRREARAPAEWRHDRPFLAVPSGKGSLEAFWRRSGGELVRAVDVATGASSPFVMSGIPGSVGSRTRALWLELADALGSTAELAIWPFDGSLDAIGKKVVIAEMSPRVCYALALAQQLPAPVIPLAKTSRDGRDRAVDALAGACWVTDLAVVLRDLDLARADEDQLDAMISAAALLRCTLASHPLEPPAPDPIEGGILGLASVSLPQG